jgi:hypothetical protein
MSWSLHVLGETVEGCEQPPQSKPKPLPYLGAAHLSSKRQSFLAALVRYSRCSTVVDVRALSLEEGL